jgi:hypothetical protein
MMKIRFLAPVLIALTAAGGCSKGVSLKTAPVSGKVTLNGQPLAGATVTFLPEMQAGAASAPNPSTGVTGADGSYKLSTMASGREVIDGAPPGNYKVVITKNLASAGPGPGVTADMSEEARMQKMKSMSPEEMAKMAGSAAQPGAQSGPPKSEVPARYGKAEESGLTATVAAGGAQTFDFPLTGE